MPRLTSHRYVGMPKTVGHDQTMGLAETQRQVRQRIEQAQQAARPVSPRIADLAARSDGTPALAHAQRRTDVVINTAAERKARAAELRRRAAAV